MKAFEQSVLSVSLLYVAAYVVMLFVGIAMVPAGVVVAASVLFALALVAVGYCLTNRQAGNVPEAPIAAQFTNVTNR